MPKPCLTISLPCSASSAYLFNQHRLRKLEHVRTTDSSKGESFMAENWSHEEGFRDLAVIQFQRNPVVGNCFFWFIFCFSGQPVSHLSLRVQLDNCVFLGVGVTRSLRVVSAAGYPYLLVSLGRQARNCSTAGPKQNTDHVKPANDTSEFVVESFPCTRLDIQGERGDRSGEA